MDNLVFGDIVLLKFPFSDGIHFKKRPALLIRDTHDGDIIVCRITSKIHNSPFDVKLEEWKESGLKLPSVIRIHKIATMEREMAERKIGTINKKAEIKIKQIIGNLVE